MRGIGQEALEFASTRQERLVHQAATSYIEYVEHDQDSGYVEHDQDSGTLASDSAHVCSSLRQTRLQGAEVGIAIHIGDDQVAISNENAPKRNRTANRYRTLFVRCCWCDASTPHAELLHLANLPGIAHQAIRNEGDDARVFHLERHQPANGRGTRGAATRDD